MPRRIGARCGETQRRRRRVPHAQRAARDGRRRRGLVAVRVDGGEFVDIRRTRQVGVAGVGQCARQVRGPGRERRRGSAVGPAAREGALGVGAPVPAGRAGGVLTGVRRRRERREGVRRVARRGRGQPVLGARAAGRVAVAGAGVASTDVEMRMRRRFVRNLPGWLEAPHASVAEPITASSHLGGGGRTRSELQVCERGPVNARAWSARAAGPRADRASSQAGAAAGRSPVVTCVSSAGHRRYPEGDDRAPRPAPFRANAHAWMPRSRAVAAGWMCTGSGRSAAYSIFVVLRWRHRGPRDWLEPGFVRSPGSGSAMSGTRRIATERSDAQG